MSLLLGSLVKLVQHSHLRSLQKRKQRRIRPQLKLRSLLNPPLLQIARSQNLTRNGRTGSTGLKPCLWPSLFQPTFSSDVRVSSTQIDIFRDIQFQSTLAQTFMLQSVSRPASSSQINTDLNLPLQGALVQTFLLLSTSRPASLRPTNTDQKSCLQRALVLTS